MNYIAPSKMFIIGQHFVCLTDGHFDCTFFSDVTRIPGWKANDSTKNAFMFYVFWMNGNLCILLVCLRSSKQFTQREAIMPNETDSRSQGESNVQVVRNAVHCPFRNHGNRNRTFYYHPNRKWLLWSIHSRSHRLLNFRQRCSLLRPTGNQYKCFITSFAEFLWYTRENRRRNQFEQTLYKK